MSPGFSMNLLRVCLASLLLLGACGAPPPPPVVQKKEDPPPPPITRLVFGGDVMLTRYVGKIARERHDPAWQFREMASYLQEADLAFVNLESPFAAKGPYFSSGMIFRAEPAMIEGLKMAGVDVVSTANNHARDAGPESVTFTHDLLTQNGIAVTGTGDDPHQGVIVERNGTKFGFLGYTYDQSNGNHHDSDPRVAGMDIVQMRKDVAALRQRANVVIVSMHAGVEYAKQPNAQQQQFARAAIEAGVRLVIGHHPHVEQPVEEYQNGVIFYSLGNFIFDQFQRTETQKGLVAEAEFQGPFLKKCRVRHIAIRNTVPMLVPNPVPR
jgi:poly-gamma-glutamate capsule biosynthesis protein CapA/YwtB (metallophosphatase superfamily)